VHLGEIAVDGGRIGAAPRLLELSVGRHSIVVTHADGRRIGPVAIEVTERHTRAQPLRPRF
jgi:hypothetical protein